MTRVIFVFILAFASILTNAQSFEGNIFFIKQTLTDTINYAYLVKDNMMRVDEMDKSLNVVHSLLINLDEKSMTAISPARKMYIPFPVKPMQETNPNDFRKEKTGEHKDIYGYSCEVWEIDNLKDSLTINYWVAKDSFDFFMPFLKISNTSDKSSIYYLQFENVEGFFPMLSIGKDFHGNELLRLEVKRIEKKELAPELFQIPSDYISFQR